MLSQSPQTHKKPQALWSSGAPSHPAGRGPQVLPQLKDSQRWEEPVFLGALGHGCLLTSLLRWGSQDPSAPHRLQQTQLGSQKRACISHVRWSLCHVAGLQQVVEVVQALAQLPDGQPNTQLPGQLQPHLHGLQAEGSISLCCSSPQPPLVALLPRRTCPGLSLSPGVRVIVGRANWLTCSLPPDQG